MVDGSFWRTALLVLLVAMPVALAAPPSSNLDVAAPLGGQELSDLATDPTGQFSIAVVNVDGTKLPSNPLGGITGSAKYDIYACNFGPASAPRSGTGCRGINHVNPPAGPNTQSVTVLARDNKVAFATAGPGGRVATFFFSSDAPVWSRDLENLVANNVTFNSDGTRLVVGAAPAGAGQGRILVLEGVHDANNDGKLDGRTLWDYNLTDAVGNGVRATSLDYARRGGVLAVGTTNGVVFLNPDGTRSALEPGRIAQAQHVHKVVLNHDGTVVAVAASNGVFFASLRQEGGRPVVDASTLFYRSLGEPVTDVALSLDGERFAAAAGNKIHFYQRVSLPHSVAEQVGEVYDAGARVASLDYDQKGQLLVAVAGDTVHGFSHNKQTPIWSFAASASGYGGVDGPLRKVRLSDTGERILVGGRNEVMAYSSVIGARGTLAPAPGAGNGTIAPGQTIPLQLTVTNTGSLPDNYTFVIKTPEGWPQAHAEGFPLDPEQSRTATFNVTAPARLQPGVFGVEVRVRSGTHTNLTGRVDHFIAGPAFNITIPRTVALVVEVPQERISLRQGSEQPLPVVIRNDGNADGVVNLTVTQVLSRGASWDLRFEQEQVNIAAGGRAEVDLLLVAPTSAASGDRNLVTIRAREGTHEANKTVTVYIDAEWGAELRAQNDTLLLRAGDIKTVPVQIVNTGNTDDGYNITYSITPPENAADWRVTISPTQIAVGQGQTRTITVVVKPSVATPRDASLTIRAASANALEDREARTNIALVHDPTRIDDDEDKDQNDSLVPGPGPLVALLALAAVAAARRLRGGRP